MTSLSPLLAFLAFGLTLCLTVGGELCRRKDLNGNDDVFECPRLFESSKKRYCCGQTPHDKFCCAWTKKADLVSRGRLWLESAVTLVIGALLLIGALVVCCCVGACCLIQRRQKRRSGHVFEPSATSLTATSPPSVAYPVQTNAYPMHAMTTPYPTEQPPPYSVEHPPFNPSYPTK